MIRSLPASRLRRFARPALVVLAALALVVGPALLPAAAQLPSSLSPLESASTGGYAALDRALARLSVHERVLVIAAHPDDEDTSLLTLIARGFGGESAYLALSRGEGGQNLIGPELGVGLGLIRSRELLAARRVDGARQFFTRAFDFGYTRSIDETFRFWPKDAMLEDAVRIVRRFRPQVIVSIFPGVPHPNHGQHQVAGWTAYQAYQAAGDGSFAGLAGEDLAPWKPTTLYRSTWFEDKDATVKLSIAPIDPVTGKSILQLAAASRSQHRSQDMGRTQDLGPRETSVSWVEGGQGKEGAGLFAGVDTRLAAIAAGLPQDETRRKIEEKLTAVQATAEQLRRTLSPSRMSDAVAPLARSLADLTAARGLLGASPGAGPERAAADFLDEKIAVANEALAAAAGVAFDAWTERETYTPGAAVAVSANLWPAGGASVENARLTLVASGAWGTPEVAGDAKDLAAGVLGEWKLQTSVPTTTPPTIPYFLRRPLQGALYDWSEAPAAVRGEPFDPAPLVARATFRIAGVEVSLTREVVLRVRDQALGEIRRPLRVVPPVEVAIDQDRLVWPLPKGDAAGKFKAPDRTVRVELISRSDKPVTGTLQGTLPSPWKPLAPISFSLAGEGEKKVVELKLDLPNGLPVGVYPLALAAQIEGGARVDLAVPTIEYPHIRPTPMPRRAQIEIRALDLALPHLDRIGYIRGASDRVPEALRQVGLPIELLGPAELAEGDLSRYDAIVVGSRAYESEPALGPANPRLLDYARAGGLLIVQYQQYPFVDGKFAPFPFDIARPHDRVTDETAPVRLLDPASPVFTTPNAIGAADWEGWIQERGLYFAHTWDPAYTPLLAMTDPDQPEQQGGLLIAKLGKGTYVYSGIAFFRELPAGVPGGYRLFANLLGLARPNHAR
ncbi:MAG TPA: PIG-L family deacetylase [Thermoanaerobaculia bacterium]|nr:PIG-L family deacetylase [Thermoanaerobaculia bacterium]